MSEQKFSELFLKELDDIEDRAQKAGLTITGVCRKAGVSRATPDRWRGEVPNTIAIMDKMKAVVVEAEEANNK